MERPAAINNSMKAIVKTFHNYLNEELSPEDTRRLGSIGLKTQLNSDREITDAINDLFWADSDAHRFYAELKARLVALCTEFKEEYEYDEADMYSAVVQALHYARDKEGSLSTVIADTLFEELR